MDKKQITIEVPGCGPIIPEVALYTVRDFMGEELPGLAVLLTDSDGDPFNTLTVSFGEFIGIKNCAYIDINNNAASVIQAFVDAGYMKNTGSTKHSGFCVYPLYRFDEEFLKAIGMGEYQKYSDAYDAYFAAEEDC